MRSPSLSFSLLAVALMAGACFAYRPVPVAPVAGTRVRIVLTSASDVTTMVPGRAETRRTVAGVLEATGRIEAAAGDTVALRLGELRTAGGAVTDVAEQVALLPSAAIARIEERRFQAWTTLLAGTGFAVLALSMFVVFLIFTLVKAI